MEYLDGHVLVIFIKAGIRNGVFILQNKLGSYAELLVVIYT